MARQAFQKQACHFAAFSKILRIFKVYVCCRYITSFPSQDCVDTIFLLKKNIETELRYRKLLLYSINYGNRSPAVTSYRRQAFEMRGMAQGSCVSDVIDLPLLTCMARARFPRQMRIY